MQTQKQTLLVTGCYGFVGTIGRINVDLSMQFDTLWDLQHDRTPTGFRQAWKHAKAECAKRIVDAIDIPSPLVLRNVEDYSVASPLIYAGDPENGIVGRYLFLSVAQDFGIQP